MTGASLVDALLFDFGNVLVEIDFRRAFSSWASASGTSAAAIAGRFGIDAAYESHERGEIDASEYFASLRRSLGIDLSDQQFLAGWNAIFIDEISGMHRLLRDLSGVLPLYLFSNTCECHKRVWMNRYRELLQPISQVFLSCELGMRKPDPEAFKEIARRIGVAPGRIAFFDDLSENVRGAEAAGLRAFQASSSAEIAAVLKDIVGSFAVLQGAAR